MDLPNHSPWVDLVIANVYPVFKEADPVDGSPNWINPGYLSLLLGVSSVLKTSLI